MPLETQSLPIAIARFVVVLGKKGGMLKKLWLSYRLGLGAVLVAGSKGCPGYTY